MKRFCLLFVGVFLSFVTLSWAAGPWEKEGNLYFLTKNTRDHFSVSGAGANKFTTRYLTYDGVPFLVRGANSWQDYGRIKLEGNKLFSLPVQPGLKVAELHFLAGGNFGNSYKHDMLLNLYGDNYFYGTISVLFAYQDGQYQELSVPIFWDWFHLGTGEWAKDGAKIKSVGNNPVRKDCNLYHLTFLNPRPASPLKDILVSDSWLGDLPFSDIFAVTFKSGDILEADPKKDQRFQPAVNNAAGQTPDIRTAWSFDNGLDGWAAGCSANWDVDATWAGNSYGKKGAARLPACNWGGDKFSWIEKKIRLPNWDKITLVFSRQSAVYSDLDKQWSDGLLRVVVTGTDGPKILSENLYSGDWGNQTEDLSLYKNQNVIIRFENHGGGKVRLSQTTSPTCDGEDAFITDIRLIRNQ